MEINTENVIKESDLKEIAEYVKSKLISLGQKTAKVSISVSEKPKRRIFCLHNSKVKNRTYKNKYN